MLTKRPLTMIRIISSSNVLPNSIDHHDRLELTPCDLMHLVFVPIQTCLIFKKAQSSIESVVDHLKATLSEALDIFYPLAGRLAVSEDSIAGTATYSIDCRAGTSAGAMFAHVAADGVSVADLLGPAVVPRELLAEFYPMNGVLNYRGVSEPLLAVQVTEIADGIVLGFAASHVAMDGTSFWHFLNFWSHIARGRGGPSPPPPVFDRPGLFDLPIRVPFPYDKLPSLVRPKQNHLLPVKSRVFRFSKETIAELKAKANGFSGGGGGGRTISSFQALMAHLWVSVTRSRGLDPTEVVSYWVTVGLRQRMQILPESYFGNAVKNAAAVSTAGEILSGEAGFGAAARRIQEAISGQSTPAEGRRFLAEWVERPVLAGSGALPRNVLITGWSARIDVFGNDFGWGPPVAARHGGLFSDGLLVPMPGPARDGTVDFEVFLAHDTMLALAQDPEFAGRTLV